MRSTDDRALEIAIRAETALGEHQRHYREQLDGLVRQALAFREEIRISLAEMRGQIDATALRLGRLYWWILSLLVSMVGGLAGLVILMALDRVPA